MTEDPTDRGALFSIVVPAHNEETVVVRCLESMVRGGVVEGELEIIVVCNGCTDATADVARSVHGPITVLEIPVASKTAALNAGDKVAVGFPRWYVDADIQVDTGTMRIVNEAMIAADVPAAAPSMFVDLADRGWLIRAYYDIWTRLPYVVKGMIGSGVYVLSESGRKRFQSFPDVIGDDAYVRTLFEEDERVAVADAYFAIVPPKSLWTLIKVRARRRIAAEEVTDSARDAARHGSATQRRQLRDFARQLRLWPHLAIYVFVRVAAEVVFHFRYRIPRRRSWARDDTSR